MNTNDKIQPTSCASSADELLEILMKEKHNPDVPFHVQGLLHLAYMRIKDAAIVPPVVQAPTDNAGKIIYSLLCTAAMTKHPDATDFDLIKTECRAAAKLLREYKEKEPPTIRCCEKTVEQAGNMVCCGEPVTAPIVATVPSDLPAMMKDCGNKLHRFAMDNGVQLPDGLMDGIRAFIKVHGDSK